jgi:hypothetical protein
VAATDELATADDGAAAASHPAATATAIIALAAGLPRI